MNLSKKNLRRKSKINKKFKTKKKSNLKKKSKKNIKLTGSGWGDRPFEYFQSSGIKYNQKGGWGCGINFN